MRNLLTETLFGTQLDETYTLADAITILQEKRLIHIGELAELAISIQSGVALCRKNTEGIDLVTGKQIKHGQTQLDTINKRAYISKRNTTAPILAVVTEQLTKKQYYFYFPYESYYHLQGNAFAIPFDVNGNPKSKNWTWNHKLDDFAALCELAK